MANTRSSSRYQQPNRPPHPLGHLSTKQLRALLRDKPSALGSISIGLPHAGALFNGQPMPKSDQWTIVNPRETWGTAETIQALAHCIRVVNNKHPGTRPIRIGDISQRRGGRLTPHVSHQSGRDVDLGFYYTDASKWYTRAGKRNLDVARTWTLVKALITEADVEFIFIDTSIQQLLREHALALQEDAIWLDSVFGGPRSDKRPIVRHIPGHKTHLHIRFYNPVAQKTGQRTYQLLLERRLITAPTRYIHRKVRRGDTLRSLARRYGTTPKALKLANRLRSSRIYAGRTYKIPQRGGIAPVRAFVVPPRRLPSR